MPGTNQPASAPEGEVNATVSTGNPVCPAFKRRRLAAKAQRNTAINAAFQINLVSTNSGMA